MKFTRALCRFTVQEPGPLTFLASARRGLIALVALASSCTESREGKDAFLHKVTVQVAGDYQHIAFFTVSREEFQTCTEAFTTATLRADRFAPDFWHHYWNLNAEEAHTFTRERGIFSKQVPPGRYVMAILDKGQGRFLPLEVDADLTVDFDERRAYMSAVRTDDDALGNSTSSLETK